MDLPKVKPSHFLVPAEFGGHMGIVKRPKRSGDTVKPPSEELLCGAEKIFHVVICLQGVPDAEDRGLLPAVMNVAVKDLKNPQAPHNAILWQGGPR